MRAVVKKWGNSAAVRIPAAIMKAAQLNVDEVVEVREQSGRVVIEPVKNKQYQLVDLLKRITRHNIHDEIDFKGPIGKEVW